MGWFSRAVSSVKSTVGRGVARVTGRSYQPKTTVKSSSNYVVTTSGTPAGQTRTTSGGTVSTPGSSGGSGVRGLSVGGVTGSGSSIGSSTRRSSSGGGGSSVVPKSTLSLATPSTIGNIGSKGTTISPGKISNQKVFLNPTIYNKQTSTYTDPKTGRSVPVYTASYFDPSGEDIGGGAYGSTERPATLAETNLLMSSNKQVVAAEDKNINLFTGEKKSPISSKLGPVQDFDIGTRKLVGKGKQKVKQKYYDVDVATTKVTDPIIGKGLTAAGFELDKPDYGLGKTTEYFKSKGVPSWLAESGEFAAGIVPGTLVDIKDKPLKNVALFGVGYGVGAGVGATTKVASRISPVLGTASKIGTLGVGTALTGAYVVGAGSNIVSKESPAAKGGAFGTATKDFSLLGYGTAKGAKGFDILAGKWSTRGRDFLDIPQADYPTAPASKQLKMFKGNVIEPLGNKPGAFHTTPDVFWKGGEIKPMPGTSELPGTYGSTLISKPFAKLGGSSSKSKFEVPTLKDLFSADTEAGVVFLQPEGFRASPAAKIKGKKGALNYKWLEPAKEGFMDVPNIKSEIESIARPDAGSYAVTNKKFYTKIEGIPVKLDVAGFVKGSGGKNIVETPTVGVNIVGGSTSYKLPGKYSRTYSYQSGSGIKLGSSDGGSKSYLGSSSIKVPSLKSSVSSSRRSSGGSYLSGSSSILKSSSLGSSRRGSSIKFPSSLTSSRSRSKSYTSSPSILRGSSSSSRRRKSIVTPSIFKKNKGNIFGGKTSKRRKMNIGRTPSLLAIGRSITSTRKGSVEGSGLSIRPILISKPKKKRKKNGKK